MRASYKAKNTEKLEKRKKNSLIRPSYRPNYKTEKNCYPMRPKKKLLLNKTQFWSRKHGENREKKKVLPNKAQLQDGEKTI